jgi:membrane associated rhomboid family serine protease
LTLIESLLFWGRLITGRYIFFFPRKIFFHLPPQVWRLATCFFLTGPDLEFVFDLYNLWRYSSALESQSGRFSKPGDFFIYILFVSTFILVSDLLAPMASYCRVIAFFFFPRVHCPVTSHYLPAQPYSS